LTIHQFPKKSEFVGCLKARKLQFDILKIKRVFATVHSPGLDGPCASCCYGRLRVQKMRLSVFHDVKSAGQSFHVRHFLDQIAPSPSFIIVDNSSDRLVCSLSMFLSGIPNRWVRSWLTKVRFGSLNRCQMRSKDFNRDTIILQIHSF